MKNTINPFNKLTVVTFIVTYILGKARADASEIVIEGVWTSASFEYNQVFYACIKFNLSQHPVFYGHSLSVFVYMYVRSYLNALFTCT